MRIDIIRIWFGIANRQISSIFDRVISLSHVLSFVSDNNLSKCQWIFMKLDIVGICFRIAIRQILLKFLIDRVICPRHVSIFVSGGYLFVELISRPETKRKVVLVFFNVKDKYFCSFNVFNHYI